MKFQIVFLSLLATAHAYEPKGPRGRGGGDLDLELDTRQNHVIPEGKSATIHCGSGAKWVARHCVRSDVGFLGTVTHAVRTRGVVLSEANDV